MRIPATRCARGDASSLSLERRGRRECRECDAPAALRASVKSTQASHYRYAANHGIPCAMVLRRITRSPRSAGLDSLRRLAGSSRARLDASVGAPGPHVFAVRNRHASSCVPPRPSHPVPRFVTIGRSVPLAGTGCADRRMISEKTKDKYFFRRGWTGFLCDCLTGKSLRVKPLKCRRFYLQRVKSSWLSVTFEITQTLKGRPSIDLPSCNLPPRALSWNHRPRTCSVGVGG